ncbi:hypothetical protein ZWY2020_025921 [Hordeum vulgare]|nr:hypothetical protein ZWY2020_025921 [Hordeum vulgare]
MDKRIDMSYCRFEGFKVLAKNYLDVIEHKLFGEIQRLLEETDMSPADVAENLMPMSKKKNKDPDLCLSGLIEALKKDAAAAKAKEEEEAAEAKKAKEEDKGKDKAPPMETSRNVTSKVTSSLEAKEKRLHELVH